LDLVKARAMRAFVFYGCVVGCADQLNLTLPFTANLFQSQGTHTIGGGRQVNRSLYPIAVPPDIGQAFATSHKDFVVVVVSIEGGASRQDVDLLDAVRTRETRKLLGDDATLAAVGCPASDFVRCAGQLRLPKTGRSRHRSRAAGTRGLFSLVGMASSVCRDR